MGMPIIVPVIGSQVVLGAYAKLKKKPFVIPTRVGYRPTVSVVIPAKNEGRRIQYALASLEMQTYPVEKVYVIDDGSTDNTVEIVEKMHLLTKKINIKLYRNKKSIGKTPGVKFITRKATTDKILVLDADTLLSDPHYIEKIVRPHSDNTTGSSYGTVSPFSKKEQIKTLFKMLLLQHYYDARDLLLYAKEKARMRPLEKAQYYLLRWSVERYREALYLTDQYFSKDSALRIYGTTLFPIGCGVLYDRKLLKSIFDSYESTLGDNLTNSEDIFIGFSIVDRGYTNIQVADAKMISAEPRVDRLPRQLYLWTSSFLQSAYYFKDMTFSLKKKNEKPAIGWIILMPIIEKITYPLALAYLVFFDYWYALLTLMIEYFAYMVILRLSAPKMPKMHFLKICLVTLPLRIMNLFLDIYVTVRFMIDLVLKRRNWRK
ncbi:MAG: glycosyltransferase family 2 protein [archaeon]